MTPRQQRVLARAELRRLRDERAWLQRLVLDRWVPQARISQLLRIADAAIADARQRVSALTRDAQASQPRRDGGDCLDNQNPREWTDPIYPIVDDDERRPASHVLEPDVERRARVLQRGYATIGMTRTRRYEGFRR